MKPHERMKCSVSRMFLNMGICIAMLPTIKVMEWSSDNLGYPRDVPTWVDRVLAYATNYSGKG